MNCFKNFNFGLTDNGKFSKVSKDSKDAFFCIDDTLKHLTDQFRFLTIKKSHPNDDFLLNKKNGSNFSNEEQF